EEQRQVRRPAADRTSVGDRSLEAVTGAADPSERRFDPEDAVQRGGDADRAAAVTAGRDGAHTEGDAHCRARGGAARRAGWIEDVVRHARVDVAANRRHAPFGEDRLADEDGAGTT